MASRRAPRGQIPPHASTIEAELNTAGQSNTGESESGSDGMLRKTSTVPDVTAYFLDGSRPLRNYERRLLRDGYFLVEVEGLSFNWKAQDPKNNTYLPAFSGLYQDFINQESESAVSYRNEVLEADHFFEFVSKFIRNAVYSEKSSAPLRSRINVIAFSSAAGFTGHLVDHAPMEYGTKAGIRVFWFNERTKVVVTKYGTGIGNVYKNQNLYLESIRVLDTNPKVRLFTKIHYTNEISSSTVVEVQADELLILPIPCDVHPCVLGKAVLMATMTLQPECDINDDLGFDLVHSAAEFQGINRCAKVCPRDYEEDILECMEKCFAVEEEDIREWIPTSMESKRKIRSLAYVPSTGIIPNNALLLTTQLDGDEDGDGDEVKPNAKNKKRKYETGGDRAIVSAAQKLKAERSVTRAGIQKKKKGKEEGRSKKEIESGGQLRSRITTKFSVGSKETERGDDESFGDTEDPPISD